MRKLLLTLALLLAPLMAFGQTVSPWKLQGTGLQPPHITDRKPIAVIYDDINTLGSGYGTSQILAENQNVGRLWKTLKEQGQEVHFYNASYFGDNTGDYLWQRLGTQYAAALCIGFDATYGTANTAAYRKFFCPDSTTAQIIHWSMSDHLRDVYGGDPRYYVGVGTHNAAGGGNLYVNNAYSGYGDSTYSAFVTPAGDSLFSAKFAAVRAVYSYPNLPWPRNVPVATINGSYAGGLLTATAGGGFTGARAELMLGGRVTWSGAAGPIWVSSVAESVSLNRVTISQDGYAGGTLDSLNAQFPTAGAKDFTFWGTDSTSFRISQVVQLFRPTWNAGDSVKFVDTGGLCRRDSSASVYSDSVASRAMELVPIAWRTYWQTQRGRTASWPNAADTTSRRWVDYVLWAPSVGSVFAGAADCTAPQLLAVLSRYALVDPQKFAYEWDDFAPFNYDKQDSSGAAYSYRWPEPDTISAYITNLARYGINVGTTTGPGDSLFAQGTVNQGGWNSGATAQRALEYPMLLNGSWGFSQHTHDSLSINRLGVVAGMVPSYAGGSTKQYPRVAFGDGALGGSGTSYTLGTGSDLVVGNQLKWGVYQRLMFADSAYQANFGPNAVIPYLSYPGDNSVPGNLRLDKYVTLNVSPPRYLYSDSRGTGAAPWVLCPPDSFYLAHAYANKKYVRGYVVGNNPFSFTSGEGTAPLARTLASLSWSDTSGFVPTRYFNFPDEKFYGKMPSAAAPYYAPFQYADAANGRFSIRCVGTLGLYPSSPLKGTLTNSVRNPARVAYIRSLTWNNLATVVGVSNLVPRPYQPQASLGEAAQGATAYYINQRNIDVGKVRMIYQHPRQSQIMYGTLWGTRNWEWETMRVAVLDPLKALNGIAGHDQIRWVQPWQVYDK